MNKYKWWEMLLVVSLVIGATLESIVPLYSKSFFNILASDGLVRSEVVPKLISILGIIAVLKLAHWIFWRIVFFTQNYFESRVMADLAKKCFAYLHQHSFAYFSNTFTGSVVKKTKSFINAFENLADQLFYQLLPSIITIIIITVILSMVNIFLGLGMLAWIILFLIINWIFTRYKLKYDIERSEAETKTSSYLADTVSNNINIKLFNGYRYESEGFSKLVENLHRLRKFSWDLSAKFYGLQAFLLVVLEVGMIYFAIRLWNKDMLTVGDFVLIQSYIVSVMMMVWDFGRVISRIYENLAEAEEMTLILDTHHEIVDVEGAIDMEVNFGRIRFDGVSFAYNDGGNIVDNFKLNIKSKETVALVGSSGAGKTTLIKLLLRMYDISKGRILVDGQDISKVTQKSLRDNISMVPQDPILFHRSLMENIRYGKMEATDKQVIEAAKLAHCDEFISKLNLGYDTFVGERGIKLSGGERQRVAIARAILRNAPILILDEATSSLDSESEKFIQDSIDELMKNKTVIIIAHRLSTIKKVDRIVVIDKKKIVEDGTHNDLIKLKKGIYRKLWDIQVGGFIK
ncbi:MAG: ABC transporter ATP-binding protein [Candidatus Shapirobacteria bacterium]|nr:ABC transporter ATP-binding protein [Candidatus Shapirobacteria bacterium]